jgi:alkylhydroperoxidase family enzyme
VSYRTSDLFTPAERVALELAEAMTATPPQVTDELFARVREFYDEAQLVELAAIVAQENFRSRFNTTFRLESAGQYCPLPSPAGAEAGQTT